MCFLDETGVVAKDNFFAVGVLSIDEGSRLPTIVQKFRQRNSWVGEWHFSGMTEKELKHYKRLVDLLSEDSSWSFTLTLADRSKFDVSAACGDRYLAYERIAAQSIASCMFNESQAVVLADEYSTPDNVRFEEDVRLSVNLRLQGNVVAAAVRVNSLSHDLMQVSDVLTGSLVYPYRSGQSNRHGKRQTAKRRLSTHVSDKLASRLPVHEFDRSWLEITNCDVSRGL